MSSPPPPPPAAGSKLFERSASQRSNYTSMSDISMSGMEDSSFASPAGPNDRHGTLQQQDPSSFSRQHASSSSRHGRWHHRDSSSILEYSDSDTEPTRTSRRSDRHSKNTNLHGSNPKSSFRTMNAGPKGADGEGGGGGSSGYDASSLVVDYQAGATTEGTAREDHVPNRRSSKTRGIPAAAGRWVTALASSFRSPQVRSSKRPGKQPHKPQVRSSAYIDSSSPSSAPPPSYSEEPSPSTSSKLADVEEDGIFKETSHEAVPPQARHSFISSHRQEYQYDHHPDVDSPLLPAGSSHRPNLHNSTAVHRTELAAAFLQDYEAGRPPTFSFVQPPLPPPNHQYPPNHGKTFLSSQQQEDYVGGVTPRQLRLYKVKFTSVGYQAALFAAVVVLLGSSFWEGFGDSASNDDYYYHALLLTCLNIYGLAMLGMDLWVRQELQQGAADSPSHGRSSTSRRRSSRQGTNYSRYGVTPTPLQTVASSRARNSRADSLVKPLILFGIILFVENMGRIMVTSGGNGTMDADGGNLILFSSVFKPLVLFYVSSQARDAAAALRRIFSIVVRVIAIELLLILMFAAVACRLFSDYDNFRELSVAWLSLFELATTVVNPSVWMPLYYDDKTTAIFFIMFIVTSVFYLHSLVLSVVFQTYIQAAGEIHERSTADREDALQLAFQALCERTETNASHDSGNTLTTTTPQGSAAAAAPTASVVVHVQRVRETLEILRPHYSSLKINALVEMLDPSGQTTVDYLTFRTKIRQALNASVRTARNPSALATAVELIAVVVAIVNFIYVILVSSQFKETWFSLKVQHGIGTLITIAASFELLVRFNPLRFHDFTPLTRLNATFDGLAAVAALTSCFGIVMMIAGHSKTLEYILIGRAIDLIRIMRFFQIFRDVVRRSSDVLPALVGPMILVVTTLHIFVYLGMGLWGGAIDVGTYGALVTPLYDLNNFNSYQEGAVTMFQVLVVNDWHAIAGVFLNAARCSSPLIVFPFFVTGNLIGVSIMLNVLTAFFVESFVTKLNDDTDAPAEATATVHKERDFSIKTAENTSVRRIGSSSGMPNITSAHHHHHPHHHPDDKSDNGADADSEGSSESELFEFDVYEREGIDRIMKTVAGGLDDQGDLARNVCNYLEIFESLSPGRENVGYLICDQQTMDRFGNRRFRDKALGFLEENELHLVVSDMHSELLALSARASFQDRSLLRRFQGRQDSTMVLEVAASLLRRQPALSLFVSRIAGGERRSTQQC